MPDAPNTPGTAPPINPEWLARMQRDKPVFLRELFTVFLAEEPKRLAAIGAAVQAGDLPLVRHHAHSLKGAAATLGLEPLRDAARELEFAARDGRAETLEPGVSAIRARMDEVFAAMRAAMPAA
jgi:HPt (histidine-containing phosphotransfer) domain-containing protein